MLFLAHAGIKAGKGLVDTLSESGMLLLLLASVITVTPLLINFSLLETIKA